MEIFTVVSFPWAVSEHGPMYHQRIADAMDHLLEDISVENSTEILEIQRKGTGINIKILFY